MDLIINLSGENLLLDLVLFILILLLPIPTAPFLVYVVINNGIVEASLLYLLASNLTCLIVFLVGITCKYWINLAALNSFFKPNLNFKSLARFVPKKFLPSENNNLKIDGLLDKASYYDIGMARLIGLHNHFVMFTFGYFNLNPLKALVVNTVFAFFDLFFYWVLVGGGTFFMALLFPELDLPAMLQSPKFGNILLLSTLFAYFSFLVYRLYRWKNEHYSNIS